MKPPYLLPSLLMLITGSSMGQISLVTSTPVSGYHASMSLHSLDGGLPKVLVNYDSLGCLILNADLSIYRSITYPPPPVGFGRTGTMPRYITETMFDTDPQTVEMLITYSAPPPVGFALAVVSESGSILLFAPREQTIVPLVSGQEAFQSSAVFDMASGAMLVTDSAYQKLKVYQLPGHIPCSPCGSMIMADGDQVPTQIAHGATPIRIFPSPANGTVMVICEPSRNGVAEELQIHALNGRAVLTQRIEPGQTHLTINVNGFAAGQYTCRLIGPDGMRGIALFQVVD